MTTFATYDLPTRDLYNRATEANMNSRSYRSSGDDADVRQLWLDSQARSAAVLATADAESVRELVALATVR